MYKVTTGVMLAAVPSALGLMSGTVFAATEDKLNVTRLDTAELSLYTTPKQELRYVEPEIGLLEQSVATIRQIAKPYATWCQNAGHSAVEQVQGVYGKVKPKVDSLVQFGNDSYAYLKNPPSEFYPRVAVIGSAGFLGLFLARGSRVKRLVYPAGLVGVGASLYYPQQAAAIVKSSSDSVYDMVLRGYVSMDKVLKGNKPAVEKSEKDRPAENSPATEAKP